MPRWIINPTVDMASILAQYGRFLESDYRTLIRNSEIPDHFEEYSEYTGRRFVIYGGKEAPGVIAKSVYLCLKLAGAASVSVKTTNLDESFLVQNVFEHHSGNVKTKLFVAHSDELRLDEEWRDEVLNATDIVVFGDVQTMEAFRDYETIDRHVWEHGYRFSFGIAISDHLTPIAIREICYDFFSFYGEGSKAPKFYFIVGELTQAKAKEFSEMMTAYYGLMITEYRNKLPLTRKSDLTNDLLNSNYIYKYVRVDDLHSDDILSPLYGDIRLVVVENIEEIEEFIEEWVDNISTVALDLDNNTILVDSDIEYDVLSMLEEQQVMRICQVGKMQFPDFFEQYDPVDDFIVYLNDDEEDFI